MTAKWEEKPIDGPWAAPDVQVRQFNKSYFRGFMAAGQTTDIRWDALGHHYNPERFANSITRDLMKQGYFDRWPQSGDKGDDYIRRIAPFTFHIVAIKPLIVVMVPHDFGPLTNLYNFVIIDWPKQGFYNSRMRNYIEYGTRIPYHPEVLWFSPDLDVSPTRFTTIQENEQTIVHKKIKLVAQKQGDDWIIKRLK
jgi:hypothetical protein